jgi:hypothetical protein
MRACPSNSFCLFALCFAAIFLALFVFFVHPLASWSQENPYIVSYDHNLEQSGSLEVEYFSTFGTQRDGPGFHAYWAELEYGATAWWTTELCLDGQTTFGESTVFTGYRWARLPQEPRSQADLSSLPGRVLQRH